MNPCRAFLFLTLICAVLAVQATAANWPQFRGPGGRSVAEDGAYPTEFGPNSNLLWKASIPLGHSGPCIYGDRIFLTALESGKLVVLCLARKDGALQWKKPVTADSIEPSHRIGSPANPTAVCDGERVYAYFGSVGLSAFTLDGELVWSHPLPRPVVEFGSSSSPLLVGDLIVQNCDQDTESFLIALNKRTGKQVWKTDRSEFRRGFASPFLWQLEGKQELVVPGSLWLKSYEPQTGKELWRMRGFSRVACASPTSGSGLLFLSSWNVGGDEGDRLTMPGWEEFAAANDKNHDNILTMEEFPSGPVRDRFTQIDLDKDGKVTRAEYENMADMFAKAENAVMAIKPGGHGDISTSHLSWKVNRDLPYVASVLHYQGKIYTIKNGGLLSCYDAVTDKPFYHGERIGALGDYYASPVGAGGAVYLFSQNGAGTVVKAGNNFEVLGRSDLGEQVFATPAMVDGTLFLRSAGTLWAFAQKR